MLNVIYIYMINLDYMENL